MSTLVAPLTLAAVYLAVSFLLLLTDRTQRKGTILLGLGLIATYLLGTGPVANALLRPLEAPWTGVRVADLPTPIETIVVLAEGASFDPRLAPGAQLTAGSVQRLVEGVRLHREIPGSRLLLSGGVQGGVPAGVDAPSPYLALAWALGVEEGAVELITGARNTEAEARRMAERLSPGVPILLVTSASHMERALWIFQQAGLDPIPAPSEVLARGSNPRSPLQWVPSANHYRMVERAVKERLGLLWVRLTWRP
jgi:uncharacterized SAM-binding protein YcdF (DUF218 family)